jgi:hypothetical protein
MNEAPICTATANTGAAKGSRRRSSNGNVHSAVARLMASGGPGQVGDAAAGRPSN